jgi:hypothetical protein
MRSFGPLVGLGTALAVLAVAAPVAVARGRGQEVAYELGYRAGQITADLLLVGVVLGVVLGGAALIRRAVRRRRADGRPG